MLSDYQTNRICQAEGLLALLDLYLAVLERGSQRFGVALLFRAVPDAAVRWRDVWLGGMVTAVLFTLGKTGIGYYLGQAGVGSPYGAAGSLVVLLVWVYYSGLIFFFGAEFTHAWATRHGAVVPKPHAVSGAAPQTKRDAAAEHPPQS